MLLVLTFGVYGCGHADSDQTVNPADIISDSEKLLDLDKDGANFLTELKIPVSLP